MLEENTVKYDEALIDQIHDQAHDLYDEADHSFKSMEEPYRTSMIIFAAQGIIDNGGLRYFFENNWTGCPRYNIFINAYKSIGHSEGAQTLIDAVSSFNIFFPHRRIEARRKYIEKHYNEELFGVEGWDDSLCGDQNVWRLLAEWIQRHPKYQSKSNQLKILKNKIEGYTNER